MSVYDPPEDYNTVYAFTEGDVQRECMENIGRRLTQDEMYVVYEKLIDYINFEVLYECVENEILRYEEDEEDV